MKIKGRLIATLAALGLLIAMLPMGPASAAAGTIGITGGADNEGMFFSDKTGFNIVTLSVTDQDLSPVRVGRARYRYLDSTTIPGAVVGFNLTNIATGPVSLAGEKSKKDELDGTADNVTTTAVKEGDAIYDDGGTPGESAADIADDRWYFVLSEIVRDSGVDGLVTLEDDIELAINGTTTTTGFSFVAATAPNLTPAYPENQAGIAPYLASRDYLMFTSEPAKGVNNIVVNYMYSEYDQGTPANTPIFLGGTTITFGVGTSTDYPTFTGSNLAESQQIGSTSSLGIVKPTGALQVISNVRVIVEVKFEYNVKETAKEVASVTSNTSLAGGQSLTLDGVETAAASSKFEEMIALFENSDYSKIVDEAGYIGAAATADSEAFGNDGLGNVDGVVQVSELNNAKSLGVDLFGRVTGVAAAVMGSSVDLTATDVSDLIALLLPVADGDTLTVIYTDADPSASVTKTATIDLAAPVVTLVSPAQGVYTSSGLLTLSAEVVDTGAGVDQNKINLVPVNGTTGISLGTTLRSPIESGYRVSNAPTAAISEGKKEWAIQVIDDVGNEPLEKLTRSTEVGEAIVITTVMEAALGAVGEGDVSSTNAFKFAVDLTGPTVTSAKTGVYLKNPGVTSGATTGREQQDTNNRNWIRVNFSLGDGTAPLDLATVTASDFRVDGTEPLDFKVNALGHDASPKGSAVYLNVGELLTDARPRVQLVGEIKDLAGNVRSEGSISSAVDGLSPVMTVTPSVDIAERGATVTISSSERLGLNPRIWLRTIEPKKNDGIEGVLRTASLQTGTFTTWTFTESNPTGAKSKQYVVVEASDQGGNKATVGDGNSSNGGASADEDDVISFELDDAAPSIEFMDATGEILEDSKQVEGAVWMVAQFDEDEYVGDGFRKVTVANLNLSVQDGESVTTDVSMLFGQGEELDCADHDNAVETDKCVNITLAIDLAPGAYNFAITGLDSVGNEVSGNVDFTVVEAKPFELELKPGVNLVSIPGAVRDDGGMLDVMLAEAPVSSVLTYDISAAMAGGTPWLASSKDPETGLFSGDISEIEPGKAYFITSTASFTVEVKLEPAGGLPPTIPVRQGYNAIGFVSISDAEAANVELYLNSIGWTVVYSYDPTPGIGWTAIRKGESTEDNPIEVEAGKGYLVYASYDATLTP